MRNITVTNAVKSAIKYREGLRRAPKVTKEDWEFYKHYSTYNMTAYSYSVYDPETGNVYTGYAEVYNK